MIENYIENKMLESERKEEVDRVKFRWIFECYQCAYDQLHAIEKCPKCYSYKLRWLKILNLGKGRIA